ncbi:MAG: hypothetical protein IPM54_20200 [Polyangiaceae bacterium]|nr:hypothetical protein [Polyangiaceae bacterium]
MLRLLLREIRGLNLKMTKWLAERTLQDEADPKAIVEIQIGFPEQRTPDEWACAFRIVGLGDEIAEYGIGVDALQALIMAHEGVATALRASKRKLSWMGIPGETCIRRQIPVYITADFANEIEAHIDAKLEAFIEAKQKQLEGQ